MRANGLLRAIRTPRGVRGLSGRAVSIMDVSPRDGLQNEREPVSTEIKLGLIRRLEDAGVQNIEATAFVAPKWVPQMADHTQVYQHVLTHARPGVTYPVLVPNAKGLEQVRAAASAVGARPGTIAIFAACSEGFSRKNTNRSMDEAMEQLAGVIAHARSESIPVRAYLSTVIGCPYDGATDPKVVARLTKQLLDLGCYEVSLGDTIGVGTPRSVETMLSAVLGVAPADRLAIHAHDTYGQGVANVVQAVSMGVRTVDSSVAGLGGCPYAKGATGNVATEDVVYALEGLGYDTGIDLAKLSHTGRWISQLLKRPGSRAGNALAAKSSL